MEIIDTTKQDKKLLTFNPFKKERMVIRIMTSQNVTLESKIIKGDHFSVSSPQQIVTLIKELIYKSQKQKLRIEKIQIGHTHKTHKHNDGKLQVGELSTADLACVEYLKTLFQYPIIMNIITDLGYTFTEEF